MSGGLSVVLMAVIAVAVLAWGVFMAFWPERRYPDPRDLLDPEYRDLDAKTLLEKLKR
jgi:hypothetical protein